MSNDERDETQRLREANAVLMEAVEHYADSRVWTQSAFEYGNNLYLNREMDNGYDIAQAALDNTRRCRGRGDEVQPV